MSLDDEIFAEERLSKGQELMLYNMSLRQTSQRAAGGREGTHVLLSKVENNQAYQEMIERGLLDCKAYGQGVDASAAATLVVTRKGLRYCVLYANEIEPNRVYDVAGVQRRPAGPLGDENETAASVPAAPRDFIDVTMGVATGDSAAKSAAVALTKEQVEHFERLGAQRRAADGEAAASASAPVAPRRITFGKERREFVAESGDVWSYTVAEESVVQVVGVSSTSKTLRVPSEIEGMAVVSIAADALSDNEAVEEIVCPDSVMTIGARAFRMNRRLKRLVLPAHVAEFKSSWIERCANITELVLPGLVEEVTREMLESAQLRKLVIGRGARSVSPGAFQDAHLAEVEIDEANPFIFTDGAAIYSKDGSELIALGRPVDSLAIAPGCTRLAKKCCCGFAQLREVRFPDTLVDIGAFAFSRSGIECFSAPPSLRVIGEKAFFGCAALSSVSLNSGLEIVEDSAFEGSAITGLAIPASIVRLGKSMTKGTGVVHSGPGCTLAIDEGCTDLFLDGAGGLYRQHEDGPHLAQLVDGEIESYEVFEGAVAIDPYAFAFHDRICTVRVAQSVRTIGRSAFRVCKNLRHVELPDGVESIGDEAFFDTNLEEFRVPAALVDLGERALVTLGAHQGSKVPSLERIEVAPENRSFYVACGMLCRRTALGASAVVFSSSEARVVFPDEVTRIEDYAFSNARGIEYLALNSRIASIGTNGLSTRCWIRHIHVERAEPLAGRTAFDFFFPDTPGAVRGIALGLGGASWVNVPGIMEQLDLCLVSARDYNAPGKAGNIGAYAQARLLLDRLDDPVMLTSHNRTMMERVLKNNIEDVCVDVALNDDRAMLGELIDRGYVNADNLEGVIERVGALRDAATSAFLLEAKREKFSGATFDYDL